MDMLTKITCKYEINNNGKFIPIKVTKKEKYKPEILINKEEYPDGELGNEFIEFTEHTKVEIGLISDDTSAIMEVESYNNEEITKVIPGEKILLSPGEEKDNMLVPGYYSILVRTSDFIYRGLYKVRPSSIEWQALLNIRNYLEKIVKGLSYNIYAERSGRSSEKSIEHNTFIFELYKYIEENCNNLFSSINSIIDKPIIDIYKKYDIKCYSKNPDTKSQRWLSKKGQRYNTNQYIPNVYYEKHSELTYNTTENKIVKKILYYIYDILVQLYENYSKTSSKLNNKIKNLENQINESKKHYNDTKNIRNINKARKDMGSKIEGLKKQKEEHEKNQKTINMYVINVSKLKNLISHYKNETWLKNIVDCSNIFRPTVRLLKDKYYSEVYETYRKLYNMKVDGKKENTFPHKKTSKLFEIYNYILIKEILEDIGFKWDKGWLKEVDNILSYNGDLLPNETIILIKDEYKIELVYDKEFNKVNDIKNRDISQLVSINSNSRRPDITINLYEKNKFIGSFIIEIKCRKKQYIYNKNEDTDVMYQLRDYSSLKYYNGEQKKILRESAIDKIIVIYPKQGGAGKFKDDLYDFSFIQVEPTNLEERPYGYEEVKKEIEEFLFNKGVL